MYHGSIMRTLLTVLLTLTLRAQTIALTHATLIDGTGAQPISDAAVVIVNGRIAAMGPASKMKIPAGAQVVDTSGKTIIPGVINAHSHISAVKRVAGVFLIDQAFE